VKKLTHAFIKAVERSVAPVPQIRNFQHESFRHKASLIEFVPDQEVVGNPAISLGAFMAINRVPGLAAWRRPCSPIEKGFEKIRVVGARPTLPERKNVNTSEHEGQRASAETERGRMRLLPKEQSHKSA
jgi:hypothetical protein